LLTLISRSNYHSLFMSVALPAMLDVWRAVSARRRFEGAVPLTALPRLSSMLADAEGEVRYSVSFDRDDQGVAFVDVLASTGLPLICQRSMDRFVLAVGIEQRLGLIRDEAEEAALPPGWEPLLVADAELVPLAVIEDELILAVPLVATQQFETNANEVVWASDGSARPSQEKPSPFAVLRSLKRAEG
jgi:uncharacterized protein